MANSKFLNAPGIYFSDPSYNHTSFVELPKVKDHGRIFEAAGDTKSMTQHATRTYGRAQANPRKILPTVPIHTNYGFYGSNTVYKSSLYDGSYNLGRYLRLAVIKCSARIEQRKKHHRTIKGILTNATDECLLHFDTKEKDETNSYDFHHHFLTVVDEFSRYTMVFTLRSKGKA